MSIEVMGSKCGRWLIFGSPNGDIPLQIVAVASIERFWFDVDENETNVVLVGRKRWLRFEDDIVDDIERALGIEWNVEKAHVSAHWATRSP